MQRNPVIVHMLGALFGVGIPQIAEIILMISAEPFRLHALKWIGPAVVPVLEQTKNNPIMKTYTILSTTILLGGLMLTSCNMERGEATEKTNDQMQENKHEMDQAMGESREEWREERKEAREELSDLRTKLEKQLARDEARLADGIKEAEKKAEYQGRVAELNSNIARINASITKLDASTGTNWNELKRETREMTDNTKNWWERQKEAVDKKTDADNDHDGH